MLPDADIVFLDEIFKSNSRHPELAAQHPERAPILHRQRQHPACRCRRCIGATNEIPNDDALQRRLRSLPGAHAVATTSTASTSTASSSAACAARSRASPETGAWRERGRSRAPRVPWCRWPRSACSRAGCAQHLQFPDDFLARYKGLVFQIRSEGVTLSDRRVVKLLEAVRRERADRRRDPSTTATSSSCATSGTASTRSRSSSDIVGPVLERYRREHPEARGAGPQRARSRRHPRRAGRDPRPPARAKPLSDVQLFSQLKNLNEIKAALQSMGSATAPR